LLVDFAIEEMRSGKDRLTALLEAGHKRARPIVMTSVAMIAGMLPVALVASASFQAQMALAVIGGLVTSTGLTLVMVPATFTWIDDLERWVSRKIGHRWINRTIVGADASGSAGSAPAPAPVAQAPGATSPQVRAAGGHEQDLPGTPLPDVAT
jgi:predicted RND superfamily exporter protein